MDGKNISPTNLGILNKIVVAFTGASALLDTTADDVMDIDGDKEKETEVEKERSKSPEKG